MRWRFPAALLVMAAPLAPLAAAQPDPLGAIDTCIARLDPQIDVGYERIAARCPDLTNALEQSGWAAWLPRGWKEPRNDLSAGSLVELRATVQRELTPRTARRVLEVEGLKGVLAELGETGQQRSSVWSRFKQWLRSLFERHDEESEVGGGFSRLLDQLGLSDAVIEIITYVLLGAVVALAWLIVYNELRAAGVLRGRARGASGDEAHVGKDRRRPTLRDVEQAELRDRPRLLLELIAAKLTDLKRLPPAGAFTVREITRAAQLRAEPDRARLADLALTAERARFAAGSIEPSVVDDAVAHGRALLTSLDSPEAAARDEAAT